MRLFGLIGYPLTHSLSKKYFTEKFEKEGLTDCRFENFSIDKIEKIRDIVRDHPGLSGIAVTIPYKQSVIPYLHSTENLPPDLPACNCIKVENQKLFGYNTDHIGFEKSLSPFLQSYHNKALILGNGGATLAIIFSLKKLGIAFEIVSRTLHNNSSLTYADINEKIINDHLLVINTSPVGTYPNTEECPDIPYQFIGTRHILYDLVYNPIKTLFLQKGEERGAVIKNGLEMLELQAEENWKIWNE